MQWSVRTDAAQKDDHREHPHRDYDRAVAQPREGNSKRSKHCEENQRGTTEGAVNIAAQGIEEAIQRAAPVIGIGQRPIIGLFQTRGRIAKKFKIERNCVSGSAEQAYTYI